jgi:hypothetical protein
LFELTASGRILRCFATEEPMAADLQSLEQRVATLERLVAELRAQPTPVKNVGLDWRKWAVADEDGIEEITRLGREFRVTDGIPESEEQP